MPPQKRPRVHEKVTLESYKWKSHTLKVDTTVELTSGDFLFIKSIIQQQRSVVLSGLILRRNSDFEGKLPKKLNEVYFVHQRVIWRGKLEDRSLEEIGINEVAKIRELVRINKLWVPKFRTVDTMGKTKEIKQQYIRDHGVLTARWKYINTLTLECSIRGMFQQEHLLALGEDECFPHEEFVSPDILRFTWRGDISCGGSGNGKYTYSDLFYGARRATCGAERASLEIAYGMEGDIHPQGKTGLKDTWENAFPKIRFYAELGEDFAACQDKSRKLMVDVLHISPRCQAFSPAEVTPGPHHEQNKANLNLVSSLLQKTAPRIVTLEQTWGTSKIEKHKASFHSLLQSFTVLGYSVSWQTVRFHNLGLSQRRRCLVVIARCVLSKIPANAANNAVTGDQKRQGVVYEGWDASKIAQCITTNGGRTKNHPTEGRRMTFGELAALQGFPNPKHLEKVDDYDKDKEDKEIAEAIEYEGAAHEDGTESEETEDGATEYGETDGEDTIDEDDNYVY
ncbi:hypothetical protein N431DRAFT_468160 [Stipitochalara longipes BDJ]|nr:hypothetical protein N431DRAFT_468160 [Stipitochalara longipes BDJ]